MLPQNLRELETAFHNYPVSGPLNPSICDYSGKYVWNYDSQFVVVTFCSTPMIQKHYDFFGFGHYKEKINETPQKEIYKKIVELYGKNEHLAYKLAKSMKVDGPDFSWIPNHENNEYNIALTFLNGETPKTYAGRNPSKLDKLWHNLYKSLPVMIGIANHDISQENILICHDKPYHFDYGDALESSYHWNNDIEKSQNMAVEMLKHFQRNTDMGLSCAKSVFNNLHGNEIIDGFLEAKNHLVNAAADYSDSSDYKIYQNVTARLDACITHLKNKL